MKHYYYLHMLVLISINSFAENGYLVSKNSNNYIFNEKKSLYIGLSSGIASFTATEKHAFEPEVQQFGNLNWLGGGLLGLTYKYNNKISCGLETFINSNKFFLSSVHSQNNTVFNITSTYHYGLRMLPSYQFSKTTSGHMILGILASNFNINDNGLVGYIKKTTEKGGIQGGLGWKTEVAPHFIIRLDMTYSYFSPFSYYAKGIPKAPPIQLYRAQVNSLNSMVSLILFV